MLIIDMIEPLIPCIGICFLELNDSLAETAPKATLAIPTHAALFTLVFHVFLVLNFAEIVCFEQMFHEQFPAVAEMAALYAGGGPNRPRFFGSGTITAVLRKEFGAFPGLDLVVHSILMAFPVIFTTEAACAIGKGAAVRTGMALDMFAVHVSTFHHYLQAQGSREAKL